MDINLTKSAQEITLKGAFVTHTRTPHICVTLYIHIYMFHSAETFYNMIYKETVCKQFFLVSF